MKAIVKVYNFFTAPRDAEEGATMVEYGLLVALVSITALAALTPLGEGILDLFNRAKDAVVGA